MDLCFRSESGLARASALAAPLRRTVQRRNGGRCSAATGGWCRGATGGRRRGATGGLCSAATEDGVGAQQADGVGALRAAVSKPASSHRWTCVFGEKAGLLARARSQRPYGGRRSAATGGRRSAATGGWCRGAASGSEQARLVP